MMEMEQKGVIKRNNTMRKLVEWEKIPVLRIGRKAIIRRDVLERFMAMNEYMQYLAKLIPESDMKRLCP